METVAIRIKKVITSQKTIKRDSKEDITNFLQTPTNLSIKKSREIKKNKQKISLKDTNPRKAIIRSSNNLINKKLLVLIPETIKS